ncbi:hypothetical protein ACWGI1_17635 [Streptomyces sp. NPDC054835]
MSEQTESVDKVMDLVAAIFDTLDIPLPSLARSDERAHYRLLDNRTADLRAVLGALLKYPGPLDNTADFIRKQTARRPVTYTPFETEQRTEGGR